MTESPPWRGRLLRRRGRSPGDRGWAQSPLLRGRAASREPEFLSDGAGLPFARSALSAPHRPLDPGDPAVVALLAQLRARQSTLPDLPGWRTLARTDDEALFGHGLPPRLTTVAVRRERRGQWKSVAVTGGATLRRSRDGIRASGWILDPDHVLDPHETVLRMFVTEQTRSGGAFADKRLLVPDVFLGEAEIRIAMFITPQPGSVPFGAKTPATPVRLELPSPIGERTLVDASVYAPDG